MGVKKGEKNLNYPKTRKVRYCKTPYNESLKIKNMFTVPETQEFVDMLYQESDNYIATRAKSIKNGFTRALGKYILALGLDFDVKTINTKYLSDYYYQNDDNKLYQTPFFKALMTVSMKLNNKYHWDTDLEQIAEKVLPIIDEMKNIRFLVVPMLSGEINYRCCRYWKGLQAGRKNPIFSLITFDTDNIFIQNLLLEFMNELKVLPRVYSILFIKRFAESLDGNLPNNIYGFNVETLKRQEKFFINLNRDAELMNRMFYRFVLEKKTRF